MIEVEWQIPQSVLRHLDRIPAERAIILLLRHSVRDHLSPSNVGYTIPITDNGRRLAIELGRLLGNRLRTLHASPLLRCIQTAEALAEGAYADIPVVPNRLLGDPGVFVLDSQLAWTNWEQLGHEGVIRHLMTETTTLPGMAQPDDAARFLVQSMFKTAAGRPGVNVFVTHDSLVLVTAARLLGRPIELHNWPWYLEGVFFWTGEDGFHIAYQDDEIVYTAPIFESHEKNRREIPWR